MEAIVFNIQRYSVNDGPGIRTLIFFKGCPLRCQWCSNPESQFKKRQIMFFENLCQSCGACADACPNSCIQIEKDQRIHNAEACEACGQCAATCLNDAVKSVGENKSVDELVAMAEKDYLFYLNSGGGVTLGGGEPTFQAPFVTGLLKKLKTLGIHTAMETCGHADWSVFERLMPHLDLLLYDVKHMDPSIHQQHTGKSNARILGNLRRLLKGDTPVIIRIPIIPGFNDDAQAVEEIGAYLTRHNVAGAIERVDLLPYHKLGVGKYKALSTAYTLNDSASPSEALMAQLAQIFKDRGFKVAIENL